MIKKEEKNKPISKKKGIMNLIIFLETFLIGVFLLAISAIKFSFSYQNFIISKDSEIFWMGFFMIVLMIIASSTILASSFLLITNFVKLKESNIFKGKNND